MLGLITQQGGEHHEPHEIDDPRGRVTGSLLTGGVIGATLAGPLLASAATTSSNAAAAAASPSATTGKFVPNEDPAHEAGESAAREAQEDAGQVPTVP
jgi:hypothetical protein